MKNFGKAPVQFIFAAVLALSALVAFQMTGTEARAQSSYFSSRGCVDCHATPVAATCAGCHRHSGTLSATANKTSYSPGETVTITLTSSGARSGWIGVRLYDQSGAEIARSTGSQSGMGGSAVYPAILSAPAPSAAGTYTWRIAYVGNEDGTGSGDVHSEKSVNVAISVASAADTTAPVVGSFTVPATSTSLSVPVSAFSATDNVAVTGYMITKSASVPTVSATGWTVSAPTSVTAVAGSNTFYAWAKDAAGNVSAFRSATVVVTLPDTAAPVVGSFTIPAAATTLSVPVSAFSATDNVAVTGYMITRSATAPTASSAGWTASAPTSVTAVAGSNTFYAWAKDAAGNVSASRSATVVVTLPDTAAPVVGSFTIPATATSLSVPVSAFSATDNVAVTGYLITTSSTPPAASSSSWSAAAPAIATAPAEGTVTFYAWAKDAAGNVSAARNASVTISIPTSDTTPPTLTVSALANGSSTNKVTLNVSGSASDSGGLQSVTVNGQAVQVNVDGSFSTALNLVSGANAITVIAIDNANNQATDSRTITYDPAAPVLTVTAPADNSTSVQSFVTITGSVDENSTVTVSVNNGSAQSAVMNGSDFSAVVNLIAGINTIDVNAIDLAGNVTSAKRTVTYSVPESQLTLAVTNPAQDVTTRRSSMTIRGSVTDASDAVKVSVKVNDRTYSPRVSDSGSFSQYVKFSSRTARTYAISVTATDASGNSATVTRNVIFRPYDGDHDDNDEVRRRSDDGRDDD